MEIAAFNEEGVFPIRVRHAGNPYMSFPIVDQRHSYDRAVQVTRGLGGKTYAAWIDRIKENILFTAATAKEFILRTDHDAEMIAQDALDVKTVVTLTEGELVRMHVILASFIAPDTFKCPSDQLYINDLPTQLPS